ncbi:DUF3794 domain-containing protein [Pontibacillus salipaludis]|uniref:SipL SPOCS domain-containing protein n=1 Tax=Pontibacillus salipaludis TaxID=1697394 RepID=A0ABQ1Q1A9_9BACI|nr:DUF3794 domain-containing protein [Pontibacillus salipaludis]GGD09063.1 hypothetical protein GCM10011389_15750 [Pontibacillus salipaludis]
MANGFLRDFVQIIGIADPSEFPVIGEDTRYTQFSVLERLEIPEVKPDVEQINTLLIEAEITSTRNIFTPIGVKVVVEGILRQKVIYTALVEDQSVHSAHFEHPFCTFIDIPLDVPAGQTVPAYLASLGLSINDILASEVDILIEDVEINLLDPRTISKCVILFTYANLNPALFPLTCDCSFTATGLTTTIDILGLTGVTATLDTSICPGCDPDGSLINLNLALLGVLDLDINVDSSLITDITCSPDNTTLTVLAAGVNGGALGTNLDLSLVIDTTADTATLVLSALGTEVLNVTFPTLGGATITDCP